MDPIIYKLHKSKPIALTVLRGQTKHVHVEEYRLPILNK